MAGIKPLDYIVRKWTTVTPQRMEDYRAGVQSPKTRWSEATLAAANAWQQGVQAALANGTWQRGVQQAGDTKWASGCLGVGATRWAQGVQAAGDSYRAGFAPYYEVIRGITLPARGARGDPGNIERVRVIADALHRAKVGTGR